MKIGNSRIVIMISLSVVSLVSISIVAVSAQVAAIIPKPEVAILSKPVAPPLNEGDCALHATKGNVQVECAIPSSTGMNAKCCQRVQGVIDGPVDMSGPPPEECSEFFKYMMKFSPPPNANGAEQEEATMEVTFMKDLSSMPKGLTCTETILPESDSVCDLNVAFEQLDVTCKLPASTKINDACCEKVKEQIASQGKKYQDTPPECESFSNYIMTEIVGPMQQKMQASPNEADEKVRMEQMSIQILPDLPSGLSCTELISGGDTSLSASHAIISAIGLARARSERRFAHYDLTIYGVTSFFAFGMLVAVAVYMNSKKNRKQHLLLA